MVPKPQPDFAREARARAAEMSEIRRKVHRYPELGFEETETAKLVAAHLAKLGFEVSGAVARTGVVGLLRGGLPGPTIALRADMDALPILEQTGLEFASERPGLMHACGHDAHVAVTLGAAHLLAGYRQELRGSVKFLFQPSEETPPGGAAAMIEEGVLDNPPVDAILGLHVNPHLPVGFIGVKDGVTMAAADNFRVVVRGRGGHGAAPHQAADAVVAAAAVIQGLQTISSRLVDPVVPVVVTVGTIHGGYKANVIADQVEMHGTVRTILPELRQQMPETMQKILDGVAAAYGCKIDLDYLRGYPPVENEPAMVSLLVEAGKLITGPGRVLKIAHPSMGGEDFAYFLQRVPGVYFYLGAGKQEGPVYPWHHPQFDINEEALPVGAAVLAQAAWTYLLGSPVRSEE